MFGLSQGRVFHHLCVWLNRWRAKIAGRSAAYSSVSLIVATPISLAIILFGVYFNEILRNHTLSEFMAGAAARATSSTVGGSQGCHSIVKTLRDNAIKNNMNPQKIKFSIRPVSRADDASPERRMRTDMFEIRVQYEIDNLEFIRSMLSALGLSLPPPPPAYSTIYIPVETYRSRFDGAWWSNCLKTNVSLSELDN